jgi:hypothetical protein
MAIQDDICDLAELLTLFVGHIGADQAVNAFQLRLELRACLRRLRLIGLLSRRSRLILAPLRHAGRSGLLLGSAGNGRHQQQEHNSQGTGLR